ncbi:MAG: hypothetical protein E7260_05925 [Lachnospiraceae bacterium]|nr:hypothetical protein [Lachnospiraceae bacterium]
MSSKKQPEEKPKKSTENYYDLKKDAVERLVNAEKKTYPKTKADPGKAYRSSAIDKIPNWIKALFIKFWFNGAVCFFILWGLGLYVTNMTDMLVVLAVVMGMVTDLLVNNAFRFFEKYEGQNSKWMMFPKKKYWTFFANIIYAFPVLFLVVRLYEFINIAGNRINGTENEMILGVEPILFGLFYLMFDMMFLGIKNTLRKILSDAKQKNAI